MVMMIKSLKEVHQGTNWDSPQMRACALGRCAAEYYSVCKDLEEKYKTGMPYFHTELGNMHLSMELIFKALAVKLIPNFDPKSSGHKTSGIIEKYHKDVEYFGTVHTSQEQMNLLKELEGGFVMMRYGEAYFSLSSADHRTHDEIFNPAIDLLKLLTKVGFMGRHFPLK